VQAGPRNKKEIRMSIEGRAAQLKRTHQELDQQIAELEAHPAADPLKIVELKKRKLAVKEELHAIERA
jgi:hypothetical protein